MGNITSFSKDALNFVADWRIWLVSAIVTSILVYRFKNISKDHLFRDVFYSILTILAVTYLAIFILNVWICMEKHKDIDFMKILKDKQTWEDGAYTTLAFVGVVAIAGALSVKFRSIPFFWTLLWLGIAVGFYFTYSVYREIVSCKMYRPDDDDE